MKKIDYAHPDSIVGVEQRIINILQKLDYLRVRKVCFVRNRFKDDAIIPNASPVMIELEYSSKREKILDKYLNRITEK